jgi:hypothetical protein
MPITTQKLHSNIPPYPKTWYQASGLWTAQTTAGNRTKLTSPVDMEIDVNDVSLRNSVAQEIDISVAANWDAVTPTDYTVGSARAGQDFYIYACIGINNIPIIKISANSTYPTNYTATNSRKIGGFHCLCLSAGTIASHPASGYLTGDIIPNSVWDLKRRSKTGSNVGLAYINVLDDWYGIYFTSGTTSAPTQVFNGTILDSVDWNTSVAIGQILGMRLPRDAPFQVAAAGSNENTNISGSADPVTTGGHSDTAGRRMISKYFLEDCCGVEWQWLDEQSYRYDGGSHTHSVTVSGDAQTVTSTSVDPAPAWGWYDLPGAKGDLYKQGTYGDVKLLAGGYWTYGGYCGSRSRYSYGYRWYSASTIGVRLVARSVER